MAAVGAEQTKAWLQGLSEAMANGKTRLEWLRDGPVSRKTKGLADHIAKIDFLKKLGADKLDLGLSTGTLKAQARSMLYRKPAMIRRMRGERNNVELACFLRLQLLRLTDDGLGMIDYRIADLWRQARTRAAAAMRGYGSAASIPALPQTGESGSALQDRIGALLTFQIPDFGRPETLLDKGAGKREVSSSH